MNLRKLLVVLLICSCGLLTAQQRQTAIFGQPTKADFDLKSYPKDPEAAAVVLFESGNYFFELIDNYIRVVKEVHIKTKVFDASKFEGGIVTLPYFKGEYGDEEFAKIKAVTHNGNAQTFVADSEFYDKDVSENNMTKTFTFPNIKDGSILEYTYRIESPYFGSIDGWYFQTTIPTLYSELHTELPGNYKYQRSLKGLLPLYINESTVKKACLSIEGYAIPADCDSATYAMIDVPAYKAENYMLGGKTYASQIVYELTETVSPNGDRNKVAQTWDDIDKYFKYDKDIGRQLKYESFFEEKIPTSILSIADELERAKAIFYHILKHFNWNNEYTIWNEIRVKEAYEKGSGNNSEINLSLINALQAGKIDAKMMLISTRENGTPTQEYPVRNDFNFILAVMDINGTNYVLDATEKQTPFGVLPYRDLNKTGRVMDFKKGSYWQDIVPIEKNIYYTNVQVAAETNGGFTGKVSQAATGYIATKEREKSVNLNQAQRNQQKQSGNENIEITDLTIENKNELELPYKQNYTFNLQPDAVGNQVYLYPFFTNKFIEENPFTAESRTYPIDFGFPFNTTYIVTLDLGEVYEIAEVPQNRIIKLPNNDGSLSITYDVAGNKINIRLSSQISTVFYTVEAYQSLKEYFKMLIDIQQNEAIVLKTK